MIEFTMTTDISHFSSGKIKFRVRVRSSFYNFILHVLLIILK